MTRPPKTSGEVDAIPTDPPGPLVGRESKTGDMHARSATGLRVVSRHGDVAKVLRSPDVARDIDEAATDASLSRQNIASNSTNKPANLPTPQSIS